MTNKSTTSASFPYQQMFAAPSWQEEVTALRENYRLIDLLLQKPARLSAATLAQYRNLQQLLLKTMEQFLMDMDTLDDAPNHPASQQLLKKHAVTMRQLNRHADSMTKAFMA